VSTSKYAYKFLAYFHDIKWVQFVGKRTVFQVCMKNIGLKLWW